MVVGAVFVLTDDDTGRIKGEQYAMTVGEGEAVVAPYEGGSSEVQLTATGLDPDITYALWLTPPGGGYDERVPAGTFRPDEDGTVDVRLPLRAARRRGRPRVGHQPRGRDRPRHRVARLGAEQLTLGRDALGDDAGEAATAL